MGRLRAFTRGAPPALLGVLGAAVAGALASGAWDPAWLRIAPAPVAEIGSSTTMGVPGIEGAFRAEQLDRQGAVLWRLEGAGLRSRTIREHTLAGPRLTLFRPDGPPAHLTARAATVQLRDPEATEDNPDRLRAVIDLTGDVAALASGWELSAGTARVELGEGQGAVPERRWRLTIPGPVLLRGEAAPWRVELQAAGLLARSHPSQELVLQGPVRVRADTPPGPLLPRGRRVEGTLAGLELRALEGAARPERVLLRLARPDLRLAGQELGHLLSEHLELHLRREPQAARAALGGPAALPPTPALPIGPQSWALEAGQAAALDAEVARVDSAGAPARRAVWGLQGQAVRFTAAQDGPGGDLLAEGAAEARAGEDRLRAPALQLRWRGEGAQVSAEGGVTWERRPTGGADDEEPTRLEARRLEARLVAVRERWTAARERQRALRSRGVQLTPPDTLLELSARGEVRLSAPRGLLGAGEALLWRGDDGLFALEGGPAGPAWLSGPDGRLEARALAGWLVHAGPPWPTWLLLAAGDVRGRSTPRSPAGHTERAPPPPLGASAGWLLLLAREGPDRRPLPWGLSAGGPAGVTLGEAGGSLQVRASGVSSRGPALDLRGAPATPVRLEAAGTAVQAPAVRLHLLPGGRALGLEAPRGWQASFLIGAEAARRPASAEGQRLWLELDREALEAGSAATRGDPAAAARRVRALRAEGGLRLEAAELRARADLAELVPGTGPTTLRLRGAPAEVERDGARSRAPEVLLRLEEP